MTFISSCLSGPKSLTSDLIKANCRVLIPEATCVSALPNSDAIFQSELACVFSICQSGLAYVLEDIFGRFRHGTIIRMVVAFPSTDWQSLLPHIMSHKSRRTDN